MPSSRRSGPVHSQETTAAIRAAVVAELFERGYHYLSYEAVARRAEVGKAAIYRRFPSRRELVVDTVAYYATDAVAEELWPDTGTLAGDVTAFVAASTRFLADPVVARITAEVLSVLVRDEGFEVLLYERAGAIRRARAINLVRRAIARRELPKECDVELAADLLAGPLYWRLLVRRARADEEYLERLVAGLIAGMSAGTT